MQSLTTPASVTKRKQACKSCRQRKKRCDGERPTCGLCRKWGIQCEYTVPATERSPYDGMPEPLFSATLFGRQPAPQGYPLYHVFPAPDRDPQFDILPNYLDHSVDYPEPPMTTEADPYNDASFADTGKDVAPEATLPSEAVTMELVLLFFEHYYPMFPCFHKASFLEQLANHSTQNESPAVLYAMCAIAAPYHPDPSVRDRQMSWFELAKFEYEMTYRFVRPAIRIIQAALLTLRHASTVGDYSSGWFFIGKAWRQACALGLNRVDSEDQGFYGLSYPKPQSAIEKEEYRRTLWLLFLTDRALSWPTGWPHAIDERQFKVDIPVPENVFQAMTPEVRCTTIAFVYPEGPMTVRCGHVEHCRDISANASQTDPKAARPTPFVRNFDRLLSNSSVAARPLNVMHYLVIAHVILGRVTEQIHSLHDYPNSPEYAQECNDLDIFLTKFRLSLPRAATSVLECSVNDRGHVIWLSCILNTTTILLHYRCARLVDEEEAHVQFMRAVAAARNTAQIVKDASLTSLDFVLSSQIGSSLYIASCVLVIQWRLCDDESLKPDIDLFSLVFERLTEKHAKLGHKFKAALDYDLTRSRESVADLKERGLRGLLADCSKWRSVLGKQCHVMDSSDRNFGY